MIHLVHFHRCEGVGSSHRRGLTLIELVVVMVILIALAGVAFLFLSSSSTDAQDAATRASMNALRNAVLAYYTDMKGIPAWTDGTTAPPGATGIPLTLRDLQIPPQDPADPMGIRTVPAFNPATQRGWRGPYILQSTGTFLPASATPSPGTSLDVSFYPPAPTGYPSFPSYTLSYLFGNPPPSPKLPGDLAFVDGWGNPIVLQWPSAGTGDPNNAANDIIVRSQYVRLASAGAPSEFKPENGKNVSILDTVTTTLTVGEPLPLMPAPNQRMSGSTGVGKDYLLFILTQDQYP